MQNRVSAAVSLVLAAGLVAAGVALVGNSLTGAPPPNSQVLLNREPAPAAGQGSAPSGDQGITGVPSESGNGQDAAQPQQSPAPVSPPAPAANAGRTQPEYTPGSDVPKDWPADVPFPEDVTVGTVDLRQHVDFVLYKRSTVALTGGEVLTALEQEGWRVNSVGTPRSGTIIGRKGEASLTFLISDVADGLPKGWVSLRLIYQSAPPPEPEPTPTETRDPLEGRA